MVKYVNSYSQKSKSQNFSTDNKIFVLIISGKISGNLLQEYSVNYLVQFLIKKIIFWQIEVDLVRSICKIKKSLKIFKWINLRLIRKFTSYQSLPETWWTCLVMIILKSIIFKNLNSGNLIISLIFNGFVSKNVPFCGLL